MGNPKPIVTFTFDDIPATAASNGARVLERGDAAGTFYVSGGLCGRQHAGVEFASVKDVIALSEAGHEIGCHTYSHADVQALNAEGVHREIRTNAEFFDEIGGNLVIENFAFPYGSVGVFQKKAFIDRFRSCRGVVHGINAGRLNLGQLKAVKLYDVALSREKIDSLVRETCRRTGWLIFYTHDVAPSPTAQGCSPELLSHAMERAKDEGCECLTVRQALDRIGV